MCLRLQVVWAISPSYRTMQLHPSAKSHKAAESCILVPIRITHPFSASTSHVFALCGCVTVATQAPSPCSTA